MLSLKNLIRQKCFFTFAKNLKFQNNSENMLTSILQNLWPSQKLSMENYTCKTLKIGRGTEGRNIFFVQNTKLKKHKIGQNLSDSITQHKILGL